MNTKPHLLDPAPFRPGLATIGLAGLLLLPVFVAAQASPEVPAESSDDVLELKPFQVVAEGEEGYRVSSASTATRTNRALIDIPQTVDIVTAELWSDIGATMVDEAFAYVPNTYVRDRSSSTDGRGINMRGFENNDSFTTDGVRIAGYKRNLAGYERLEIVKGPSAAVQGRAGGTGLFNFILKKPKLSGKGYSGLVKLTTGFDEYDHAFNQGMMDADLTLNQSRTLGFRLVAVKQKADDYIDFQGNSILAAYPSFRWKITDKTEIVLTNELIKSKTPARELGHGFGLQPEVLRRLVPQFNTPTDPVTNLHLPRTFNLIGPDNPLREELAASTLFINQQFNENIFVRVAAHRRYFHTNAEFFNGENNLVTRVGSNWTKNVDWWHNTTLQADMVLNYRWRWFNSSTMLGYTYSDTGHLEDNYTGTVNAPYNSIDLVTLAADPRNPAYWANRKVLTTSRGVNRDTALTLDGVYVHETLGVLADRVIFSGGVRQDTDKSKATNLITGAALNPNETTLTSPQYGVTFKVRPNLSLYAIHSIQNDPTQNVAEWSNLLSGDPRINNRLILEQQIKMTEFGLKAEVLKGRLTVSANYFDMERIGATATITQQGITQGVERTLTQRVPVLGATSKGFEVQVFGAVTPRFNVIANYTKMTTGQDNTATPETGDRIPLRFAPEWNVNLFGRYSFRGEDKNGWTLRAGTNVLGPLYMQVTNVGLVYLDKVQYSAEAGISYRWGRYEADVLVKNATDEVVMVTRDNAPRYYRFSLTARF